MATKYNVVIDVDDSSVLSSTASIDSLTGSVSGLESELDSLQASSDSAGDEMEQQADAQEDLGKSLDKTTTDTQQLTTATSVMGGTMGTVAGILPKVQKGLLLVSTGFKTMRGAIISTGIGALIILLGSLIEYFTSTGEGAAKLQQILAPFKVLFGNLTDLLSDLGGALVSAFEDPKQAIINLWEFIKSQFIVRIQSLVKIVQAAGRVIGAAFELDWDGVKAGVKDMGNAYVDAITGVEDSVDKATNAIGGFIAKTVEEAKILKDLEKRREELRKRENLAIVSSAKLRAEIAEQRLIAEDEETYTIEQREAALKKAQDAQAELFKEEKAIASERADIMIAEATLSKTGADAEKEIAEAKADLIILTEQQAKADKKLLSVSEFLSNERVANAKAETAAEIKEINKREKAREKAYDAEVKRLNRLASLSDTLFDLEKSSVLEKLSFDEQLELLYETNEMNKLDIKQKYLEKIRDAEKAYLDEQLGDLAVGSDEWLVKSEEFKNKKLEIDNEYKIQSVELNKEKNDIIKEQEQQRLEEIAAAYDEMIGILNQFGLGALGNFVQMADAISKQIKAGAEITINEIGALASAGLHAAAGIANMIADQIDVTSKEGFEKQKKARQAGAIMDAFAAAIAGMLAGLSAGGPWGIALGAITAAASLAFGLAQADKIGKMKYGDTNAPGGGGGPNINSGLIASPPGNITSPVSPIQGAMVTASNELPPTKAYVVSDDVVTGNAIDRSVEANAAF